MVGEDVDAEDFVIHRNQHADGARRSAGNRHQFADIILGLLLNLRVVVQAA